MLGSAHCLPARLFRLGREANLRVFCKNMDSLPPSLYNKTMAEMSILVADPQERPVFLPFDASHHNLSGWTSTSIVCALMLAVRHEMDPLNLSRRDAKRLLEDYGLREKMNWVEARMQEWLETLVSSRVSESSSSEEGEEEAVEYASVVVSHGTKRPEREHVAESSHTPPKKVCQDMDSDALIHATVSRSSSLERVDVAEPPQTLSPVFKVGDAVKMGELNGIIYGQSGGNANVIFEGEPAPRSVSLSDLERGVWNQFDNDFKQIWRQSGNFPIGARVVSSTKTWLLVLEPPKEQDGDWFYLGADTTGLVQQFRSMGYRKQMSKEVTAEFPSDLDLSANQLVKVDGKYATVTQRMPLVAGEAVAYKLDNDSIVPAINLILIDERALVKGSLEAFQFLGHLIQKKDPTLSVTSLSAQLVAEITTLEESEWIMCDNICAGKQTQEASCAGL